MANQYNNKVILGNETLMDITDTTATASDVAQGKIFYTANGARTTGTASGGGGGTITQDEDGYLTISESGTGVSVLQSKSVTPSETAQTVTADTGFDALSSVSVGAISSTYVGTGVTRKAAATITPGTTNKTIAANQYLTGVQTIQGDSDLIPGNIKSGVNLFGVTGTYEGSGGGGTIETCTVTFGCNHPEEIFAFAYLSYNGNGLAIANGTKDSSTPPEPLADVVANSLFVIEPANKDSGYWVDQDVDAGLVPPAYADVAVVIAVIQSGYITIEG